jgi:hypothetical protein
MIELPQVIAPDRVMVYFPVQGKVKLARGLPEVPNPWGAKKLAFL